ncbi:valacyclovir hydrolase-like isoform X2 [Acanthaster planci]|uniref:Valacyclovir hydrolase-like isoform X2 n=1 Tax=Acanthaster planci TaxID=133434 RepID=A0A8B7YPX9_ACAPL|nr:valacyclovir hydrolase-like isoform X2 [Acanthaster planci]
MAFPFLYFSSKCTGLSTLVKAVDASMRRVVARNIASEGSKVAVNGVELRYDQTGKGNHAVLLLPGALGSGRVDMKPQFEGLSKDKYTLVTFDPRGYGKSRPPDRDFPLDFFHRDGKDAASLMSVLGHDRYSVLGWSDGAITGIIMAATYPDHVQKLLVWGGNAYVTKKDLDAYEATRDICKWSERMRAPMVELYDEEYFQKLWSSWIDSMRQIWSENRTDLCMADCRRITCPTLIIHGEKDFMVPIEHAHYLNQNIRGSRVLIMPEGKHNLHMRYAEEFNQHAEIFLDSSANQNSLL